MSTHPVHPNGVPRRPANAGFVIFMTLFTLFVLLPTVLFGLVVLIAGLSA